MKISTSKSEAVVLKKCLNSGGKLSSFGSYSQVTGGKNDCDPEEQIRSEAAGAQRLKERKPAQEKMAGERNHPSYSRYRSN